MTRAANYDNGWPDEADGDWEWSDDPRSLTVARLAWLVAAFVWALLAASMLSFDAADRFGHAASRTGAGGETSNWIGAVGAAVSAELFEMLGVGAWLMLALTLAALLIIALRGPITHLAVRALGAATAGLAVSGFHAILAPNWSSMPEGGGGLAMIALTDALRAQLGLLGTGLTLSFMLALGLWVALDRYLIDIPVAVGAWTWRRGASAASAAASWAAGVRQRRHALRENDLDDDRRLDTVDRAVAGKRPARRRRGGRANDAADSIDPALGGPGGSASFDPNEHRSSTAVADREAIVGDAGVDDESAAYDDSGDVYDDEYVDGDTESGDLEADDDEWEGDAATEEAEYDADADDEHVPGAPQVFDREALKAKIANLPIRFAHSEKHKATQEDLDALRAQRKSEEEADRNYRFPGLDLLEDPEENFNQQLEKWVRDQAEALEEALQTYRIEGEVVGIESGPVITLYRVRLAPGTKVSQLSPVSSDIARMLKAVNIRIVPNEAGTDTVGIEVPNLKKEKVRLKELMTNSSAASRMKLPLFLGKDASGNPLIVDLASLPHLLIAGTTGSGKSVCMNAIISGFLYTQKPSDLKLVLVDPKMVELSQFKNIPHLMCPVVTEMSKAAAILEWAVTKMDERYELLAEAGVRDISGYNNLSWEELLDAFNPANELEEARIPRKLPYMVFVIDELADLMMTNKEVEGAIVRIAQKARAVGIHLVLATQRPQANVVTGLIKSNMPGRIAFKVASGMDSRIVLDQKGGELLLGHGDMLMLTPRSGTTIRAQGTLVDDAEIRRVVRFVHDVSGPTYERDLAAIDNHGFGAGDDENDKDARTFTAEEYEERMRKSAQEDPLFDRAVEIVLETKRGSVSLLQRRLAIGYTRASRLIELMGMSGIIGKHKGSVAREVLMSLEEWEAMKQLAEDTRQANDAAAAEANEDGDDEFRTHDESEAEERGVAGRAHDADIEAGVATPDADAADPIEARDNDGGMSDRDASDKSLFAAMGLNEDGEPLSPSDAAPAAVAPAPPAEASRPETPPFDADGDHEASDRPLDVEDQADAAVAPAILNKTNGRGDDEASTPAPVRSPAAVLDDDPDDDDDDDPDLGFDEEDTAADVVDDDGATDIDDAEVDERTESAAADAGVDEHVADAITVDDGELDDEEPSADADAADANDEVEYVYLDEDGNPIDPDDLDDDDEYEYLYEADDAESESDDADDAAQARRPADPG